MREVTFHRELADAFRAQGYWVAKWPDQVISRMQVAHDGKMRFALPKPFDLLLCSPSGRFGGIEAKLLRAPTFKVDARLAVQLETLRSLAARGAYTALALNFRFERKRTGRVNRAFLVTTLDGPEWKPGETWMVGEVPTTREGWLELKRISGGWRLAHHAGVMSGPSAIPQEAPHAKAH